MNEIDERYEGQLLNEMFNQQNQEIKERILANREKYYKEQEALNKIKEQMKIKKLQEKSR